MRKIFALFLASFVCLLSGQSATSPQPKPLVLAHVTVIDATGAPAKPDMTVVITGNRITAIGKDVAAPQDAQVIDASGKFLIPGLWDMHIHWYDKNLLTLFTANGVTGVRQMFGMPVHLQWRHEFDEGKLIGPRMLLASPIVDGPKPVWPGSIAIANETEGRKAVDKIKKDGYDFVKVYSLLPRDAYFGIADEAKRQGISFAGHVPISVSAAEASDAGQKSIEHLTGVLLACSSREDEFRAQLAAEIAKNGMTGALSGMSRRQSKQITDSFSNQKAAALFARFAKNGTWQCPTLTVLHNMAYLDDKNVTNDPRLKYMPPFLRRNWDPSTDFRMRTMTPADYANAKASFQKSLEVVRGMRRAGVEIIAGTDTLNPYCFPGFSLHDELGLLVRAGLTPLDALQTATINAAKFLGKLDSLGTVEQGKIADLVLLDANPLEDIGNTKKINAVVMNGRLFDRKALDRMLNQAEAAANTANAR